MTPPRKQAPGASGAPERLDLALAERDAALVSLAAARAELDALRLRLLSVGEPEPAAYPTDTTPGAPPLRYVLVDELHGAVKGLLDGTPVGKLLRRKGAGGA